jgi:hypothetical protein
MAIYLRANDAASGVEIADGAKSAPSRKRIT